MKEKLLQFFTGKMSKSIYISIAAAVVCGAVVITSTVIVHNNNQKIDSVLESLAASESLSDSASESDTESISDVDNTDSGAQAKAPNGEPASDKALQYLAEYDKLTAEYEAKRAELAQETLMTATKRKRLSPLSHNYFLQTTVCSKPKKNMMSIWKNFKGNTVSGNRKVGKLK